MEHTKEHTSEPWVKKNRDPQRYVNGEDYGSPYIYSEGDHRYVAEVQSSHTIEAMEANATRIVTCVNACAGLTNDEVKDFGKFARSILLIKKTYRTELKEVKQAMVHCIKGEKP